MKRLTLLVTLITLAALPAFSQTVPQVQDFIPDLANDTEMTVAPSGQEFLTPGYGGLLMPVFFNDNRYGINGSRTTQSTLMTTAKLWARISLGGNSFLYLRGKDMYSDYLSSSPKIASYNMFDLDSGYVEIADANRSLRFAAGRKFYSIGSGIVLNGRGDGASVDLASSIVDFDLFGFYTGLLNRRDNHYWLSVDDYDKGAKRVFAGGTLSKSFYNQTIYAFSLVQIDNGTEPAGVKTHYNSQYYGGGLKGVLVEGFDYVLEGTYEMGKSYTDSSGANPVSKSSISALMADVEINYYFDAITKPSIKVQYAFGSGDADRTYGNNGTQMVNGSSSDTAFVSFGSFDGGLALRPSLSNIHVIRAGIGFIPFDSSSYDRLKKMSAGFTYSYYMKDKASAPINMDEATTHSADIGQGFDFALRWKIYYELSFFAQYGLFAPGKAYGSSTLRSAAMVGTMLEF